MCRWMAYRGQPLLVELLLYKTKHSLIEQSRHARLGVETFNGDGFGLGWYDGTDTPGLYRSMRPAWSDRNLSELAAHVTSPLFFAHVRASTGSAVQDTNCHPFRYGRWLFMHNGLVREFGRLKRDMLLGVDASLLPMVEGSTDSELLFYLALTFGAEDDPITALERVAGFIEAAGERHGVGQPLQMAAALTDGAQIIAVRYSSEAKSRTLFYGADARAIKEQYPNDPRIQSVSDEVHTVVSEPLADLAGAWKEIPESSVVVMQPGQAEFRTFVPRR
jgi:predicted glutamine amidotransferase